MRRDELRLRDMVEHIDSAQLAVRGKTRLDFEADPTLRKAVQYDLFAIGEAASRISKSLQSKYSQVGWKDICGIRNVLAHEYFSIDLAIIWETATADLAPLRSQIEGILEAEFPDPASPA